MQRLEFEKAWDRTIAQEDRKRIEKIFSETGHKNEQNIVFTLLNVARNHKKDLLVMVLIHNFSLEPYQIKDETLEYKENNQLVARHRFALPTPMIPAQTSMPWTFIFPENSLASDANLVNGSIEKI
ncbi:hypothetical protein GCM10011351_07730 [Paraliobacillus quinghaiensis]|uniref:SLAP domain-containing protein n=1 Tax=Paraliobacillus quinghaiensis TaxID=470815 RepID=A0A917TJB3_9BACI|nr:SLAP domain-containing protein [Paraliobacillus quinghaiensis]GGM24419.1 hypothetical protein GCM10011351_07730 [Paraliobacillus quinghaiensis]